MKNFLKITALSLLALTFSACTPQAPGLPQTPPSDFQLDMTSGGGMSQERQAIHISAGHGSKEETKLINEDYKTVFTDFQLTDAELSALYKTIIFDNKIADIKTNQAETYDSGGLSIIINFGETHIRKDDNGTEYVDKSSAKQFTNIVTAINTLADEKTKGLTGKVE